MDQVYSPAIEKQRRKELRDYEAKNAHEQKILDAGWEPYSLPETGMCSAVEPLSYFKVRPYVVPLMLLFHLATVMFVVLGSLGAILYTENGMPLLNALAIVGSVIFFLCAVFFGIVSICLWIWAFSEEDTMTDLIRYTDQAHISSGGLEYSVYTGAFPPAIWERYSRTKHLFDHVVVWTPNRHNTTLMKLRVFNRFSTLPALATIDPVLVGIKGDRVYQGGVWDIETN